MPYCVSLTPPDQVNGRGDYGVVRKAPSVDGVYYGQGDCSRYFGIDATTGGYVEYTAQGRSMYFDVNLLFASYGRPVFR